MQSDFRQTMVSRRRVVASLAGAIGATALAPPRLRAQAGERTNINGRLSVISGFGGNVLVHANGSGTILVDSGAVEHGGPLLAAIDDIAPLDGVQTLFNTHWHLDQTGSNAAIHERGATIIAHAKTRAHLSTPYYLPAEDRYQAAAQPAAQPTRTFYNDGILDLGDDKIHYGYLLEAHTDGDIYVLFENDNVIAVGDAISPVLDPVLDWYGGGWLGGRVDALQLLLDISDDDTRFVPSYGPVVDRSYVESEHALMLGLFEILWERVRAGESPADIYASGAVDALPRRFDDPMRLLYDAHKSMWAHYNTLSPDIV